MNKPQLVLWNTLCFHSKTNSKSLNEAAVTRSPPVCRPPCLISFGNASAPFSIFQPALRKSGFCTPRNPLIDLPSKRIVHGSWAAVAGGRGVGRTGGDGDGGSAPETGVDCAFAKALIATVTSSMAVRRKRRVSLENSDRKASRATASLELRSP